MFFCSVQSIPTFPYNSLCDLLANKNTVILGLDIDNSFYFRNASGSYKVTANLLRDMSPSVTSNNISSIHRGAIPSTVTLNGPKYYFDTTYMVYVFKVGSNIVFS